MDPTAERDERDERAKRNTKKFRRIQQDIANKRVHDMTMDELETMHAYFLDSDAIQINCGNYPRLLTQPHDSNREQGPPVSGVNTSLGDSFLTQGKPNSTP